MDRLLTTHLREQIVVTQHASTPTTLQKENDLQSLSVPVTYADQSTVDAIESSHRQWLACHLVGDYFRVWALEGHDRIRERFLTLYGPLFSLETIRDDLERLEAGAIDTPFQTMAVASDTLLPKLVTSGWDTTYPYNMKATVWIPIYWSSMDGSVAGIRNYLTEEPVKDPRYALILGPLFQNQVEYIYDAESNRWQLNSFQIGNGGG